MKYGACYLEDLVCLVSGPVSPLMLSISPYYVQIDPYCQTLDLANFPSLALGFQLKEPILIIEKV